MIRSLPSRQGKKVRAFQVEKLAHVKRLIQETRQKKHINDILQ